MGRAEGICYSVCMSQKRILLPLIISVPLSCISVLAEVGPENFTIGKSDANAPSAIGQISGTSEMNFDDAAGGFSLSRVIVETPLGGLIHLNDSSALSVGLRYEGTWLESDTLLGDTDLHDLRVSATWLYHTPGSKWSWLAGVEPGLASDFEHITNDSFSVNWKVATRYAMSDRFALVAGVGSHTSTGDNSVVPSFGFQWKATDDIYVSLVGTTFTATWQPSDDWLWRVGVWTAGGVWNVENGGSSFDVKLSSYRAGLGAEYRIHDKVWLTLWAGATLGNELEIETAGGGTVFKDDADTGWFVNLGLRVAAW